MSPILRLTSSPRLFQCHCAKWILWLSKFVDPNPDPKLIAKTAVSLPHRHLIMATEPLVGFFSSKVFAVVGVSYMR